MLMIFIIYYAYIFPPIRESAFSCNTGGSPLSWDQSSCRGCSNPMYISPSVIILISRRLQKRRSFCVKGKVCPRYPMNLGTQVMHIFSGAFRRSQGSRRADTADAVYADGWSCRQSPIRFQRSLRAERVLHRYWLKMDWP